MQTSILFELTAVKQSNVYGMCTKSLFLKSKFKINCIFEGGGIWNADVIGEGDIEMLMVADGRGMGVKNHPKSADVITGRRLN